MDENVVPYNTTQKIHPKTPERLTATKTKHVHVGSNTSEGDLLLPEDLVAIEPAGAVLRPDGVRRPSLTSISEWLSFSRSFSTSLWVPSSAAPFFRFPLLLLVRFLVKSKFVLLPDTSLATSTRSSMSLCDPPLIANFLRLLVVALVVELLSLSFFLLLPCWVSLSRASNLSCLGPGFTLFESETQKESFTVG